MANESKNNVLTKDFTSNARADSGKLKEEMMEFFDIYCRINVEGRSNGDHVKKAIKIFLGVNNRPMGFSRKGFWLTGNARDLGKSVEELLSNQLRNYLSKFDTFVYTEIIPGAFLLANLRGEIVGMLYFGSGVSENFVFCYGPDDLCQGFGEIISTFFTARLPETVSRLSLNAAGNVVARNKRLQDKKEIKDFKGFWPYFSLSPAELAEAFDNSNNNVLVLYGAPGLGKSQFIREMIRWKNEQKNDNVVVADTADVLNSPSIVPYIHDLDDGTWLVTEDQLVMLERRENGNSLMSGLLNAAEGITSGNVKFIISTNLLNLKSVDNAIIRPGRLFKALSFRTLNETEAAKARSAVDLEPVDFAGREKITLAEALNWETFIETESMIKTSFI